MDYINKLTPNEKILDISVNLARVSDWMLVDNESKQRRVDQFLDETKQYMSTIARSDVSIRFQKTFDGFVNEFKQLLKDRHQEDKYDWAERALTWANILQHRAKYA